MYLRIDKLKITPWGMLDHAAGVTGQIGVGGRSIIEIFLHSKISTLQSVPRITAKHFSL